VEIRSHLCQQAKKKPKSKGEPESPLRLDVAIFFTLGPAAYLMNGYSLVRDFIIITGGHSTGGYWAGLVISLLALWTPWNTILKVKRSERIRLARSERPTNP
jgi:hypothetical protein